MRSAQAVLQREAARDRQLSDVQRRAVALGSRAEGLVLLVSLFFTTPFVVMIGSSLMRGLFGEGAEARRQLVGGCAYIPTVVILVGLAALAYRSVRAMRSALEASCAAVPPMAPGQPARCRVCGGPVAPQDVERVARCGYCQADNLVDPAVLEARSAERSVHVTDYAAGITTAAHELHAAGRSRALFWVAAVPLCTCLCGCPNIFLAYRVGLAESPTAECEHVLVPTPEGPCIAERRGDALTIDGQPVTGPHERISGARGMRDVRLRGASRTGRLTGSVSRARRCGGVVRVRWDDERSTTEVPAASLCVQ